MFQSDLKKMDDFGEGLNNKKKKDMILDSVNKKHLCTTNVVGHTR